MSHTQCCVQYFMSRGSTNESETRQAVPEHQKTMMMTPTFLEQLRSTTIISTAVTGQNHFLLFSRRFLALVCLRPWRAKIRTHFNCVSHKASDSFMRTTFTLFSHHDIYFISAEATTSNTILNTHTHHEVHIACTPRIFHPQ